MSLYLCEQYPIRSLITSVFYESREDIKLVEI